MVKQCLKAIIHRLEMMVVLLLAIVLALVGLLIAIYGNGGAPVDLSQPAYQGNLLFSNTLGQVINFILTPLCVSLCCADCLFMQMKNGLVSAQYRPRGEGKLLACLPDGQRADRLCRGGAALPP